jgi:hypothetical protein
MTQKTKGPASPRSGTGPRLSDHAWRRIDIDKIIKSYPKTQRPAERALRGALLPPEAAKVVVQSARYQEFVRHFQAEGYAKRCGCGHLVILGGVPIDCDCAFDAYAYETLADSLSNEPRRS